MRRLLFSALALVLAALPVSAQTPAASPAPAAPAAIQKAYFAGGCFWCMQYAFDKVPGVTKTVVGYTGGKLDKPDYEDVSSGSTGHAEAIEVQYNPQAVAYDQLLTTFWHNVDPTATNRQFADAGTQYRTAIFYTTDAEKRTAEDSKAALAKTGKYDKPIVTEITPATAFYPAEEYHQEYYKKNSMHFQAYEVGSGRAGYIQRTWGDQNSKKK